MAGDPACWSHIFFEDDNPDNSDTMTKATTKSQTTGTISPDLEEFLKKNDSRMRDELFDFLRIPSVSAKSEHNPDTKRAAEWVKKSLDKIGVPAKIYPTKGHPVGYVLEEFRPKHRRR